jgi:NAD(P)-dependent dehydrogenase (short-subunit alcohol dehydrogenase family)
MEQPLTDKVALVTGGGSGIGRAACVALAQHGAIVAVVDLRAEPAERVASEIVASGGKAIPLVADVSNEASISQAIADTIKQFGRLHTIFANAGINGMLAPIEDLTLEEWNATLNVNVTGTFLTVKHAIPHLRAAGGGSIIVTASLNGNEIFSATGYTAYSTSKAGQTAFAKMAAFECARWNIRVNTIMPGAIETNIEERTYRRNLDRIAYGVTYQGQFPPLYGRFGKPEEIADLVVFLASDASRYMTGAVIPVDAALSLIRS